MWLTGQLSVITALMQFAGSMARIFTTLKEVNDALILISNCVACILNGILVLQIGIYTKKTRKIKKKAL